MKKRKPSVLLARMSPKLAEALSRWVASENASRDWLKDTRRPYHPIAVRLLASKNNLLAAYEDMAEPRPKNTGKWKTTRATVLSDGELGIVHTSAKARVRVAMRAGKKVRK